MDYAKLKTEIETDPAKRGYAALVAIGNDQGIADLLNAQIEQRAVAIPMRRVLRWLATTGVLYSLNAKGDEKLAATASQQERRVSAISKGALEMIRSPHVTALDLSDPTIAGMIDALVAANLITSAQKSEIQALAQEPVSRAIRQFERAVTAIDIAVALGRKG
jgi:hypothetical protein